MNKQTSKMIAVIAIAASLIMFVGCLCPKSGTGLSKIAIGPKNQLVAVGGDAIFTVAVEEPPLSYQWTFNGTKIPGATNAFLLINNVQFSNVGTYRVEVTAKELTKTSDPVRLGASSTNGTDGTLSQVIDAFVSGSASCASGFTKYWSFFPPAPPYGFVPPAGTTKVAIDTFDTRNSSLDTAVEIFKRPGLVSICCNDNAQPVPSGFSSVLSCCTNVTTQSGYNYRFGLYAKGNIPTGTVLYLNYHFY